MHASNNLIVFINELKGKGLTEFVCNHKFIHSNFLQH